VLASSAGKVLRLDIEKHGVADGKLAAAGLLVINPPWQFEADMRAALVPVLPRLDAEIRFDWLAGEA
jgi:23S rRNA (adenine2030-N6)-methyltransferase